MRSLRLHGSRHTANGSLQFRDPGELIAPISGGCPSRGDLLLGVHVGRDSFPEGLLLRPLIVLVALTIITQLYLEMNDSC